MRKYVRCQAEMIENCDIKVQGAGYGIILASDKKSLQIELENPEKLLN